MAVGDNYVMWGGNHVGHHSTSCTHTFVASHAVISGSVTTGEHCFLGANATLRGGVTVGERCTVGPGGLVMAHCEPDGMYVGTATARSAVPSGPDHERGAGSPVPGRIDCRGGGRVTGHRWVRVGRVFGPASIKRVHSKPVTHASNPVAIPLGGSVVRFLYSGLADRNRSIGRPGWRVPEDARCGRRCGRAFLGAWA